MVEWIGLIHCNRDSPAVKGWDYSKVINPVSEKRFLFLVQQTPFFALQVMRRMPARIRRLTHPHN